MCCCPILFFLNNWEGLPPAWKQSHLRQDCSPGGFLQWVEVPSETRQKGHKNMNAPICSLSSRPQNHTPQRETVSLFSFGHFTVIIVKKMSPSSCDYPTRTNFLLTWFCFLKNRCDKTFMFACLPLRCTLFRQTSTVNLTVLQPHTFSTTDSSNNCC